MKMTNCSNNPSRVPLRYPPIWKAVICWHLHVIATVVYYQLIFSHCWMNFVLTVIKCSTYLWKWLLISVMYPLVPSPPVRKAFDSYIYLKRHFRPSPMFEAKTWNAELVCIVGLHSLHTLPTTVTMFPGFEHASLLRQSVNFVKNCFV